MLAVGSSLSVYPAADLPVVAVRNGARLVIVNDEPTPYDELADLVVRGRAGEVLADAVDAVLGGRLISWSASARSSAASTCSVVQGNTGISQSACLTSSSSSVQPRITPWAPASQSSSMTPTTVRARGVEDLAVHQLAVDDLVDRVVPCRGRARRPAGRARRAGRRRTAAASCTTCRAARRVVRPRARAGAGRRRRRGAGTGCRRRPRPGRRRCGTRSCTSAAGRRRRPRRPRAASASTVATSSQRPARCSSVSSWNSTLDSTRRAECRPPSRCSTPRLSSL